MALGDCCVYLSHCPASGLHHGTDLRTRGHSLPDLCPLICSLAKGPSPHLSQVSRLAQVHGHIPRAGLNLNSRLRVRAVTHSSSQAWLCAATSRSFQTLLSVQRALPTTVQNSTSHAWDCGSISKGHFLAFSGQFSSLNGLNDIDFFNGGGGHTQQRLPVTPGLCAWGSAMQGVKSIGCL